MLFLILIHRCCLHLVKTYFSCFAFFLSFSFFRFHFFFHFPFISYPVPFLCHFIFCPFYCPLVLRSFLSFLFFFSCHFLLIYFVPFLFNFLCYPSLFLLCSFSFPFLSCPVLSCPVLLVLLAQFFTFHPTLLPCFSSVLSSVSSSRTLIVLIAATQTIYQVNAYLSLCVFECSAL